MADNTIGQAYVQILPSAKGIKGELAKTMSPEADEAGKTAGGKLSGALKGVISKAAIGAALVKTIKEGARYEQAVGGIETMFKSSSDTMIKYANEAWKTAGVSANDYMEQATSFSASLLQSLNGDTKKAAESANQAIIDMADNSNKFGTELSSIQFAYQGFAKQNYTMLDNLKLGYGGTKAEMERLLADAGKLSGQKYDISNLNDVYSAIHVIQQELGVTGTTSKEAASTLSGSFNAMKASASNFMAQLVAGEDISGAMSGLVQSASTFLFQNLIPAVLKIGLNLPIALAQGIITGLPQIIAAALKLVVTLAGGLVKAIPKLVVAAEKMISGFVKGLHSGVAAKLGKVIDKIKGFFKFHVDLPKIKLPHFSISPPGWKLGDLLKGKLPHLGIEWYAKGGIVDKPTLMPGLGDDGPEAAIPLRGRAMKPFAEAIANNMNNQGGGITYNIGDITLDVKDLEDLPTLQSFAEYLLKVKQFA